MTWMTLPARAGEPARFAGAHAGGHTPSRFTVLAKLAARLFGETAPAADPLPRPAIAVPSWAGEPEAALGRTAADIPAEDRNLLFAAVTARLRDIAAEPQPAPPALRSTVLECVEALEHLHGALQHERGLEKLAERELVQTRAALAAAQRALAGTQAGERRARHEADHDSLTLLPNSGHFRTRLGAALNTAEDGAPTLAVLFIDLDGFKPINDRHGHDTGDELLRIVAQRLNRSIRAGDLVCRMGGDEFACMLSNVMGHEQLSQLAAKLFDAVSAPLKVGELKLTVRPSIGIARCPTDGTTAASLLKRADTAMYRAKRQQLGFAFFDRGADA